MVNKYFVFLLALLAAGCGRRTSSESNSPEPDSPKTAEIKTVQTKSGVEVVLISAGEFLMGDDNGEEDQRPAHRLANRATGFAVAR